MGQGVAGRVRGQSGEQRRKRQDAYQGHRDDLRGYGASRHPAVNGEDVGGGYLGDLFAVVCPRGVRPGCRRFSATPFTTGYCRVTVRPEDGTSGRGSARIRLATTEQVWELVDAMHEHLRSAVLLGAFAGLRMGEVCGLRIADVDFVRGVVYPKVHFKSITETAAPLHLRRSTAPRRCRCRGT